MKNIMVAAIYSGLSMGCTSTRWVEFDVTSNPISARIESNGVTVCETPCLLKLSCLEQFVGLANSQNGFAPNTLPYQIIAYPTKAHSTRLFSQSKMIQACQQLKGQKGALVFDLELDTVAPKTRIETN